MAEAPVCVIILNYNAMDLTLACLDSVVGQTVVPDTIIVCDNGSSEDVPGILQEWAGRNARSVVEPALDETEKNISSGKVVLIRNKANLGYAGGNNPGIRYALRQERFKYIWILNNDTQVKPNTLQALLACAEARPDAGLFGSTVVSMDRPDTVQCAGGCTYNPLTTVFRPAFGSRPLSEVLQTEETPRLDYIYGASMFVRTRIFEECGLLNDDYFLFYEEMDLCKRALKAGFKLSWCRESIVYHKGSETVGKPGSGDKQKIAFANYHENLSTLIFTKKFYPYLLPVAMWFRFFGKLFMMGKRGKWYLLKPLLHAYRDFWVGKNLRTFMGQFK
jgi:hypothetical protein